jgi:GalNAc-alpha-(1->4)-GalNAc-alpha-(1->3)-diNAcBac-PP-undecaprenol alpha-1,4-N-acetyl-D-galactosaminyltransferase
VSFIDQTNVYTLLCLVGTGIPVIVSERVHPAYNPIARIWHVIRRLIYPIADAVTVQTEDGAEWFRRCTGVRRLVVIPNAVRFPQAFPIADTDAQTSVARPLILAMGRLVKQKGFDLLLDAFHRSRLMENGWHLTILGEGVERDALELQATKLGIADAVTLPGFVSNVGQWLMQADIFVLSSRYEGFPNALMEAMQLGRATISFDCQSGPKDLIENNYNGYLVPAEDIHGLSEALRHVALDASLRSRLGTEAIKISDRFSPETVYKRWLQLLDTVATGDLRKQYVKYPSKPATQGAGIANASKTRGRADDPSKPA